ncbi:hypothetical protein D9M68_900150 [compost metagenome]
MGLRHALQLLGGFRQGDIEHRLAAPRAFKKKLQRNGRLAGARRAFDEVEPVGGEATAEHVVQAGHADLDQAFDVLRMGVFLCFLFLVRRRAGRAIEFHCVLHRCGSRGRI